MSWLSSFWNNISGKTAINEAKAEAKAQSAALQAREDKRQADIRAGQGQIDSAFSQFTPDWYNNFRTTYLNNYNPDIAHQYELAKDKLVATLAGRGMLESTPGAVQFGQLQKTRNDAESSVANAATDAANNLRTQVEGTKSNLYGLNLQAADPAAIGAQAQSAATSLVSPGSLPSLGNVFQSVMQPLQTFNKADFTSMNPQLPWNKAANPYAGSSRGSAVYTG